MSPSRRYAWISAVHRALLRCYPPAFRAEFGVLAEETFDARLADAARRGPFRAALFVVIALADVPQSGWAERLRRRSTPAPPQRSLQMRISDAIQDARVSGRMLWRSPGPAVLSIVALALGIGAMTSTFSVVDAVVLRPLPYAGAGELVRVRGGQSYLDLADFSAETRHFRGFGGYRGQTFDLPNPEGAERVDGALVTGRLFELAGARAALGRLIIADDDRPGAPHVAVISHGFWLRHFGGRPDAVGSALDAVDRRFEVIGVLPPGFQLPLTTADVIAALRAETAESDFRGVHSLTSLARMAPGVDLSAAQADVNAVAALLGQRYPQSNRDRPAVLQRVDTWLRGDVRTPLMLLFAAVGVVWLIACANVTSLQLGRTLERRDEMAVRRAIGASRGRIFGQLIVEQLIVSSTAGLLGAALAWALVRLLLTFGLESLPRLDQASVDGRTVLFAAGVTLVTTLLLGILPAIMSTREGGPGSAAGPRVHGRGRHLVTALLVSEIAVTLALTIGGALLFQSYARLMKVDPGFDPESMLTFNVTLRPLPRLPRLATREAQAARVAAQAAERNQLYAQVIAAVGEIPGVTAVGASTDLPIAEGNNYHNIVIDGRPAEAGKEPEAYYRGVNDEFFAAMKLPIVSGRAFTPYDMTGREPVAIVNETFAAQFFPGRDAIGKRVNWLEPNTPWLTIVGVARDVKGLALDADEVPAIYGPYPQDLATWRRSMDFAVRSTVDPRSLAAPVRQAVASIDPTVPAMRVITMRELIGRSTAERRFMLTCLEFFSVLSITLIVVGLCGVVSYAVRIRTAEFGVRLALGARPGSVVLLALKQAWWSTLAGALLGIAAALAGARVLNSLLFHVSKTDALTYTLSAVVVVAIATVAAFIPARRAGKVDPLMLVRRSQLRH